MFINSQNELRLDFIYSYLNQLFKRWVSPILLHTVTFYSTHYQQIKYLRRNFLVMLPSYYRSVIS